MDYLPAHDDLIGWFARRSFRRGKLLSVSPSVKQYINERLDRALRQQEEQRTAREQSLPHSKYEAERDKGVSV